MKTPRETSQKEKPHETEFLEVLSNRMKAYTPGPLSVSPTPREVAAETGWKLHIGPVDERVEKKPQLETEPCGTPT